MVFEDLSKTDRKEVLKNLSKNPGVFNAIGSVVGGIALGSTVVPFLRDVLISGRKPPDVDVTLPEIRLPDSPDIAVEAPDFRAPRFDAPTFEAPTFKPPSPEDTTPPPDQPGNGGGNGGAPPPPSKPPPGRQDPGDAGTRPGATDPGPDFPDRRGEDFFPAGLGGIADAATRTVQRGEQFLGLRDPETVKRGLEETSGAGQRGGETAVEAAEQVARGTTATLAAFGAGTAGFAKGVSEGVVSRAKQVPGGEILREAGELTEKLGAAEPLRSVGL